MKQNFEMPTEESVPEVDATLEEVVVSPEDKLEAVRDQIRQTREDIKVAEASRNEQLVLENEERIRALEQEASKLGPQEEGVVVESVAEVDPKQVQFTKKKDIDERIKTMRDQIAQAEKKNKEDEVLRLEEELRGIEIEKKDVEAHIEYEIERDAALARGADLKERVGKQIKLVKEVENSNEKEYTERLATLRGLESQLQTNKESSENLYGDTFEEYKANKEKRDEPRPDYEMASEVSDLDEDGDTPANQEEILNLRGDEREANDIYKAVNSPLFQLSPFLYGLFPRNKKRLKLLDKLNIPYKTKSDRAVKVHIASGFRRKSVKDRKKKLGL